ADLCVPRLNEGDQVVLINGRDISDHTHDQVVMFIKASCESHSGELILLVRPNAIYDVVEEKADSEPDFQYIPGKSAQDPGQTDQHAWRDSMITLKEGLASGGILAQFDVRPSIYDVVEEKADSEPDFQYIPGKSAQDPGQTDQHAWRDSMITLKEGLASGGILAQFD
ncbi:hypothetical protein CRUP_013308, partial [Coryphaenoides rupestris]